MKAYLKILNPKTDSDLKVIHWYTNTKAYYSDFVRAKCIYLLPGRELSVDEQLIPFKSRSNILCSFPPNELTKDLKSTVYAIKTI